MGEEIEPKKKKKIWPFSYESILNNLKEVPDNLKACSDYYFSPEGQKILQDIADRLKTVKFTRVIFVGNTFNYFASLIAVNYLNGYSEKVPFCWESYELSEFYDYILPSGFDDRTLYIFISKSGKSRLLEKAIEQLYLFRIDPNLIWLITNFPNVDCAKRCGVVIPILSNFEIILGTNSFPNTMFLLFLITQLLIGKLPISNEIINSYEKMLEDMKNLDILKISSEIVDFLGEEYKFIYCLARGASMAAAESAALGAKSFGRFYAEATTIGLFFHGPFQIADENFRCVVFVGRERDKKHDELLQKLIKQITKKLTAGKIVLVSNNTRLSKEMQGNPQIYVCDFNCDIPDLSSIFEMYIFTHVFLEIARKMEII